MLVACIVLPQWMAALFLFLATHRHFFVLSQDWSSLDWVMHKMNDDGLPLTFKRQIGSRHGDVILAEVSLPADE